ncbi:MupG family TIM beta-alpha barrel fold protein [Staphylococcus durrellii]|uniref:MupG family TIM beta-alpha barrel fold protein n=1 Tax=Staphylococcus durrellii TaxID=2781773 RepID=UPI0018A04D73|nr:MupG family TIM beta-alpha barrel fold protein [Staphylococcus durrellii]MBF7016404.1 DUF871 family protein [Staphylococcus durrellii]
MHGFSVYLGQDISKNYVQKMIDLNYDTIFTSMQIPEENDSTKVQYLTSLLTFLQDKSITYIVDINPKLLNAALYNALSFPNADIVIRIDTETSIEVVNDIIRHGFKCCLNASTVTYDLLNDLVHSVSNFKQLVFCHNYYPRPDTGLDHHFVTSQNDLIFLFNHNATIYGFIPGSTKRGPLYKGLPTLEEARYGNPIVNAHDLLETGINNVIIGDNVLNNSEAYSLSDYLHNQHFTLKVSLLDTQYESIFRHQHTARADNPSTSVRSQEARSYLHNSIAPLNTVNRKVGDITIDNHLNGRYEGELQLIKTTLPSHNHVNVAGHIIESDIELLHCIKGNNTFSFNIN